MSDSRRFGVWSVFAVSIGLVFVVGGGISFAQAINCTECHDVAPDALAETVHGFLECGDCHLGTEEMEHTEDVYEPACENCHDDAAEEFEGSIHGRVRDPGLGTLASGCAECHGAIHELIAAGSPESPIHGARLAETCGRCHASTEMAERFEFHLVQPIEAYEASVHARAVEAGEGGATCSTCHGSHDIQPAIDPESKVNHQRVPETCGTCHVQIAEEYVRSVHGQAAAHGIRQSPVCTDCHGEHRILEPQRADSPTYPSNIPMVTCGKCHEDVSISEKYGLNSTKVHSYQDSYHGLANRSGAVTVAQCASCHGVHDILPSSNPASHVHQDQLAETCGQCHPGAGEKFAIGPIHVEYTEREHAIVYYVRIGYIWLIILTIGGMILHNSLDLLRKLRSPMSLPSRDGEGVDRLSGGFRLAHAMMAISFIVLAYTGFALKYPESWWAVPLLQWESTIGLRGWIHRVSAIVMLGSGVVHAVHLAMSRDARLCIKAMKPGKADLRELIHRFEYFFGKRPNPPEAEWVGYPEKAEYLALIWGTLVMAVTGFVLWFETLALRFFPTWVSDLSTVVHFYEAILATLAIVVWHFYAVIFDPVVYPMDTAWLTGKSCPGRSAERMPPPVATEVRVGKIDDRFGPEKLG